ncbi:MAG: hypothetical protein ACK8QZ_03950 [Anaerolineales bacterium]
MPNINNFPAYFQAYIWEDKHPLYGYPGDAYPEFSWISSLESRFGWLRENCVATGTASRYLMQEMIQWGGSQNGVLQKFDDGVGEVNLYQQVAAVIRNLNDPALAIASSLDIPGMGLTYASKMLRFMNPSVYGALDSRVRNALQQRAPGTIPRIFDGNRRSMVAGYVAFLAYLADLQQQLDAAVVMRPQCNLPVGLGPSQWRAADIEMALFGWAAGDEP